MSKLNICALLIMLYTYNARCQEANWGIVDDDISYQRIPRKAPVIHTRGLKSTLPEQISYESFMPPVLDQGIGYQTCVALACGYYLRSALEAIQHKTIGVRLTFSPTYLYEKIKVQSDYDCSHPCSIEQALNVLSKNGAVLLNDAPYPNCGLSIRTLDAQAARYRIGGYQRLFDISEATSQKIEQLRMSLADGFPVVIGFCPPPSFQSVSTDRWQPTPDEKLRTYSKVGHALCIIGYDDKRFGGSFRIINSQGKKWGQDGLCWISYTDLASLTKYGFQAYPAFSNSSISNEPGILAGGITFQLASGEPMPVTLPSGSSVYQMTKPYPSGTEFRFMIDLDRQAYVYALGTDDRLLFSSLFPIGSSTSALLSLGNQLILPGAGKVVKLDDRSGTDYFILILSDHELDLPAVKKQLTNTSGNLLTRLQSVLGQDTFKSTQIHYENDHARVQIVGRIVPIVVQFEHH